jgi:hypothetical protein
MTWDIIESPQLENSHQMANGFEVPDDAALTPFDGGYDSGIHGLREGYDKGSQSVPRAGRVWGAERARCRLDTFVHFVFCFDIVFDVVLGNLVVVEVGIEILL